MVKWLHERAWIVVEELAGAMVAAFSPWMVSTVCFPRCINVAHSCFTATNGNPLLEECSDH